MPATDTLGLAEGIETAMAAIALLDLPVWSTLGAERLHQIAIPASVRRLVLLPDNDRAGRIGQRRAAEVYARGGIQVDTIWPPMPFNDWNDVLRAEGEGVGVSWRRAA